MTLVQSGDPAQPKVSVCLLAYQHEQLISDAIEGALGQETPFPVEIVIGEDCSTDRTRDLVEEFARRFPESIRAILPDANRGLLRNFMETYGACRGEYIALLDGDDYWTDPRKLVLQTRYLDEHPDCSMCFHNASVLLPDGTLWEWNYTDQAQAEFASIADLLEVNPIATCSAMVRRACLPGFPSWFETLPWEDWPLYMLLAERGRIGYLSQVMAVYRNHGRGLWSGLGPAAQFEAKIEFLSRMDGLLEYRYSTEIRQAVSKYRGKLLDLLNDTSRAGYE